MILNFILKYIGFLAAFCTTVAFFPQAVKVWKTKSTRDISLYMFVIFTVGVISWLIYGITISDLLKKLKITKQSLNRVLKDLNKKQYIIFKKDHKDTRVKHIFLTDEGNEIYQKIFEIQKKRIYKVLLNSTSEEVAYFNKIINI